MFSRHGTGSRVRRSTNCARIEWCSQPYGGHPPFIHISASAKTLQQSRKVFTPKILSGGCRPAWSRRSTASLLGGVAKAIARILPCNRGRAEKQDSFRWNLMPGDGNSCLLAHARIFA
jgi:hypothetical protein